MEQVAQQLQAQTEQLPPMQPPKRSRWPGLLLWALVLALGAGAGAALAEHSSDAQHYFAPDPEAVFAVGADHATSLEPAVVRRIRQQLRGNQVNAAKLSALGCLRDQPSQPQCHKLLGTVYARLSDPERAAEEYERFVQLAPDHVDAPKVRAILEQYRAQPAKAAVVEDADDPPLPPRVGY